VKYEFCWTVSPSRCRGWQETIEIDGLELEIVDDRVLVRTENADDPEEQIRSRAGFVVADLVRSMSLYEGLQLSHEFSYVKATPDSGLAHLGVDRQDGMVMSDNVAYTAFAYIKCDAVIVKSSERVNLQSILSDVTRLRRSQPFRSMVNFMIEFRADPQRKLAPLYDILEIATTEFGGRKEVAKALRLPEAMLGDLGRIANDPAIRTARHPGRNANALRDISAAELSECERTAEEIIRAFAGQIRN
jgi:hypothetical protein